MKPDDLVVGPTGLRFRGRRFACTVGRAGVTGNKKEGDGATPRGVHQLVGVMYRPDRMAQPVEQAIPIMPRDLWSDDPADDGYNDLVSAPYTASHERLRRSDPMYDLVVLTNWNWPDAVPGKGSAIFIHQWRGPGRPTAGCIGLSRENLHWIVTKLRPLSRLIVL